MARCLVARRRSWGSDDCTNDVGRVIGAGGGGESDVRPGGRSFPGHARTSRKGLRGPGGPASGAGADRARRQVHCGQPAAVGARPAGSARCADDRRGELAGGVHVGNTTPSRFTEEEIEALQLVVDRLALAVHMDRTHSERTTATMLQESSAARTPAEHCRQRAASRCRHGTVEKRVARLCVGPSRSRGRAGQARPEDEPFRAGHDGHRGLCGHRHGHPSATH